MIVSDEIDDANPNKAELFDIEISSANNEQLKNFMLQPFDVINIRKMAVYEKPEMVSISGAIPYGGKYVLASKKEKVYDVIQRAGGLTAIANIDGVMIKRPIEVEQIENLENIDLNLGKDNSDLGKNDVNLGKSDTIQKKLSQRLKLVSKFSTIPIDWRAVVKDPQSSTNVRLFPGDSIIVATYNEGVQVMGNVLLTSEIPYRKGKGFRYYLSSVGGVDAKGWTKKAYIIYPNGSAAVASSFFFIRSYPKVKPGSQIVVPEKPEVKKMTTAEFVSIGSVMASLALLILTAFK